MAESLRGRFFRRRSRSASAVVAGSFSGRPCAGPQTGVSTAIGSTSRCLPAVTKCWLNGPESVKFRRRSSSRVAVLVLWVLRLPQTLRNPLPSVGSVTGARSFTFRLGCAAGQCPRRAPTSSRDSENHASCTAAPGSSPSRCGAARGLALLFGDARVGGAGELVVGKLALHVGARRLELAGVEQARLLCQCCVIERVEVELGLRLGRSL